MLITKAQYYHGGQSVCRNKSLQKMFMMLGAAEKAGSGVDKILKESIIVCRHWLLLIRKVM